MTAFGTDAIWYQWTSPLAVHSDGITFAGWVSRRGNIVAASLESSSGVVKQCVVAKHFNADDHAAPALLIRQSDKRILLFYTKHNDRVLRWRISEKPLDISSWGPEQTYTTERNCAYPQIAQLSSEGGRIFVFFRHAIVGGDQRDWAFLTSEDHGHSFSSFKTLRTNFYAYGNGVLNPYTVIWSDGISRIDFASTNYEQLALGGRPNSIYHFYYEGGSFFRTDGTTAASLDELPIVGEDQLTVVTPSRDVNLWDIARGPDGHPVIAWVHFEDYHIRHVAVVARWTGELWEIDEVSLLGGPVSNNPGREWYSGGICLNKADPDEIFLSIQSGYGQFGLSKWARTGSSWERRRQYLGDQTRKNFRPISPVNADPTVAEVLWVGGAYQDLQDYGPTRIIAYPGPTNRSEQPAGFRGALSTSTTNQTLSAGATDVQLKKVIYDTDRFVVSPGVFRVPLGVQAVRLTASVRFTVNQAEAFLNVVKNGQTHPGMAYAWGSGRILAATSSVLLVEPGDEFRCRVQAASATVEAHHATWLSIEVVE